MTMELKEHAVPAAFNGVPNDMGHQPLPCLPVAAGCSGARGPFAITAGIHRHDGGRSLASQLSTCAKSGVERRSHRRRDMETQNLIVDRRYGNRRLGRKFGTIVDLSVDGMRVRTRQANLRPGIQIHVRLELPAFAGISPFIHARGKGLAPTNQWVGWMSVIRFARINEHECEVAGRLIDMEEIDRGMLGLYLSAQPLAVSGIKSSQQRFC